MPQETVNQITRALRLKYNVDKKKITYKELLTEVKQVENLLSYAKSQQLNRIGGF